MKKISYLLLGLFVFSASSCEKYLETVPQDFISPANYYSTEKELNIALAGVYDAFAQDGTYSRHLAIELVQGTDETFRKRDDNNIFVHKYNHDATESTLGLTWKQLYDVINRANLLLANINKPSMTETKRNDIKGQTLFLRAHAYFWLVSLWGDVPLILEPVTSAANVNRPRTPSVDVYNQILTDMTTAEALVSTFNHPGTISKSAVQGVLARVCLKMAGYPLNMGRPMFEQAKSWALKVVQSGIHRLNPDYAQIFINQSADQYDLTNKECIWEIEFTGNNVGTAKEGSRFANILAIRFSGADIGYGYASVAPNGYLFKMYGTDATIPDVRRDWNIAPFKYTSTTNSTKVAFLSTDIYNRDAGKWRREYEPAGLTKSQDWGPTNFPVLRYADVLLMLAEAENELNGPTAALPYFNQVRARAVAASAVTAFTTYPYGSGLSLVAVDTKDNFRLAIMSERARELAYEGLRKMDLIRWHTLIPTLKAVETDIKTYSPLGYSAIGFTNAADKHYLLPIPSLEISLNKSMTQNLGWN
ncbi:MAG: RagB/SusD family nutrient uptake outer membrane protein [Chitinophagaceae bacterium]